MNIFQGLDVDANLLYFVHNIHVEQRSCRILKVIVHYCIINPKKMCQKATE